METPSVMEFDDLPSTEHAHEFVGEEHGDVPFSIILVHAPPGAGPRLHRHPYAEVFVVESGEARFQLGDDTMVVVAGRSWSDRPTSPTASPTPEPESCASRRSTARPPSTPNG
jgi:quercetin dioxygenase-like cupin family protein